MVVEVGGHCGVVDVFIAYVQAHAIVVAVGAVGVVAVVVTVGGTFDCEVTRALAVAGVLIPETKGVLQ